MVLLVARSFAIFMFGTKLLRSSRFVTSWLWIVSAVTAATVSGTLCRSSARRRAVTTISSRVPLFAAAPVVASGSAAPARPAETNKYAMKALHSLRIMVVFPQKS